MSEEQAIEDGHPVVFEGALKGSKIGYGTEPPKVRFVRPDVAIVVVGGGSSVSGAETPDESRESTLTYVLVREDDGWRIASFQNTRRIPAFMPGGAGAS